MKISMATNIPFEFFGEKGGLELLKKTGFDTVDYSLHIPGAYERLLSSDYLEYAKNSRSLLEKIGMSCNQAHAGFKFEYGMEMNDSCPEYLYACRCIEYASVLGAEDIVVHTIWVPNKEVDAVDYNIGFYKSLEPFCERFGIRIAVENAAGTKSVEQINRFCEALTPEHFSVCVDIGHINKDGYVPGELIRGVAPGRVRSLHIHDNHGQIDEHTLPYLGNIDWNEVISALVDIGYCGDFTMEAGKFLRAFPNELKADAMKLYYSVARHLAEEFEKVKEARSAERN